jgi:hypothetical protein
MNQFDFKQKASVKSLTSVLGWIFKIWLRRMITFVIVITVWAALSASGVSLLKTIAPFVGIAVGILTSLILFKAKKS